MNAVDGVLTESLRGFSRAPADSVSVSFDPMFVTRKAPRRRKVALISGGGSGSNTDIGA